MVELTHGSRELFAFQVRPLEEHAEFVAPSLIIGCYGMVLPAFAGLVACGRGGRGLGVRRQGVEVGRGRKHVVFVLIVSRPDLGRIGKMTLWSFPAATWLLSTIQPPDTHFLESELGHQPDQA